MYRILAFLFILSSLSLHAQELNFKVSVVVQTAINNFNTDQAVLKELEKSVNEFINTTKWTDDEFQVQEKIRGTLQITVNEELAPNVFKGEIILQTERPVYGSNYHTPMINLIDKSVTFTYNGLTPLLKTSSTFYDNLSSIISFYAYMTIGFDYDSFSLNGGEALFNKAMDIITSLPSNYVAEDGWKTNGSGRRNRYWLIENILNPRMRQFRQAFYEYHRLCLDKMYEESDKSRAIILSALTSMGQANLEYPNTYLLQVFGDAKKDEIIEIFKVGDKGQKAKVSAIMVGIDASKKEKYNALN